MTTPEKDQQVQRISLASIEKVVGAKGLNIEGGSPHRDLLETSRIALPRWVNLVTVLDCPLDPCGGNFEDLLKEDRDLPLLENRIHSINEPQLIYVYMTVILDCVLEQARQTSREPGKYGKIVVHIHQFRSFGGRWIALLKGLLNHFAEEHSREQLEGRSVSLDQVIDWRSDQDTYADSGTDRDYQGTLVLISLSQCAGLSPEYPPGSMFVPNEFIPFDLDQGVILGNQRYAVDNALTPELLLEILQSPLGMHVCNFVNQYYRSSSEAKKGDPAHIARVPEASPVHCVPLLQVSRIWNPTHAEKQSSQAISYIAEPKVGQP